ncbi:MAG TPA: hypothetical protein VKH15_16365 [Candidatus Acidoferrum sp.]|nr:hypothetical protein [Candidatus Acidoferrum sp.]
MLFGHNTDVKVGDAVYHVQTEDRGTPNALVDTTVYCRGRVLHRRTNNYLDLMPLDHGREDLLRKRIDDQHRAVTEEIRSGALKLTPPPLPAKEAQKLATANPAGAAPRSGNASESHALPLALELLNARNWLSGKRANLQVAVRQKQDGIAVAGARVVAHIEGSPDARRFSAVTGLDGHAQLEFEVPQLPATESALVIEATLADAKAQLKFQLRARTRVSMV